MNAIAEGTEIRITFMKGEPNYTGRTGKVTLVDDAGNIHGTWGGCAIIPNLDKFEILQGGQENG